MEQLASLHDQWAQAIARGLFGSLPMHLAAFHPPAVPHGFSPPPVPHAPVSPPGAPVQGGIAASLLALVAHQIAFLQDLQKHLTAAGMNAIDPLGVVREAISSTKLVLSGRLGDDEVISSFRIHNPTAKDLPLEFSVGELLGEGGLVPGEVFAVDALGASPTLSPGETREVRLRVRPRLLPRAGSYRGRVTVRSPEPKHLLIELQVSA